MKAINRNVQTHLSTFQNPLFLNVNRFKTTQVGRNDKPFRVRKIAQTSMCSDIAFPSQRTTHPNRSHIYNHNFNHNISMQQLTSYIARVSNPSNQSQLESAPKLLAYCIKHQHWSVFEHCYITMEITTSKAVASQILRHRSFVFQEFSMRYAQADNYYLYPARNQDLKNRQNSTDTVSGPIQNWFQEKQHEISQNCFSVYAEALNKGIAKEQARFVLPLNTQTVIFMTGNIRSWIHYVQLRSGPETQKEHREIVLDCQKILEKELPDVWKSLGWTNKNL